MIRKIAILLLLLAAAAGNAPAQVQSPSIYAPGRERLANDTFRKLVDLAPLLDKMNLAGDLAIGDRILEDHPTLRTALLENLIFDYCNISDSLKTVENFRVTSFLQRHSFTFHSFPEWNELGRLYAGERAALEKTGENPLPLYLLSDPLAAKPSYPRLWFEHLSQAQGDLAPAPSSK